MVRPGNILFKLTLNRYIFDLSYKVFLRLRAAGFFYHTGLIFYYSRKYHFLYIDSAFRLFVIVINRRSFSRAMPESIDSSDSFIPALKFFALDPATSAAAAFNNTTFLFGPFSPFNTESRIWAFSSALPPFISTIFALFKPNFS